MAITIDGVNLLITLPAATPTIDVEADLYSEWKKWTLLDDNLRFEQAFTTEGGAPTIPGEVSGKNFFARNDLGWRIRPAEEDAEVNFIGNLFKADAALALIVPTLGGFTVLVQGVQSSLSFVKETGTSGLTGAESAALLQNTTDLSAIAADIAAFQIRPPRGVALDKVPFYLVEAADSKTPATGKTPTVEVAVPGAAFAAAANAAVEQGQGWYYVDLTAAEMDGEFVLLRASDAGTDIANLAMMTAPVV